MGRNRTLLVEEQGLLEALVHCREDVFRQQRFRPNEVRPSRTHIESVPMRKLLENDFEQAFLACQRKAASYLLLCDGMAYVAGGEPLYYIVSGNSLISRTSTLSLGRYR